MQIIRRLTQGQALQKSASWGGFDVEDDDGHGKVAGGGGGGGADEAGSIDNAGGIGDKDQREGNGGKDGGFHD
jgi:hypothetical protein